MSIEELEICDLSNQLFDCCRVSPRLRKWLKGHDIKEWSHLCSLTTSERELIGEYLARVKGDIVILDIGCRDCFFLLHFLSQVFCNMKKETAQEVLLRTNVYAIDFNKNAIEEARKEIPQDIGVQRILEHTGIDISTRITLEHAHFPLTKLKNESCNVVIDHIGAASYYPDHLLSIIELGWIMKRGGILYAGFGKHLIPFNPPTLNTNCTSLFKLLGYEDFPRCDVWRLRELNMQVFEDLLGIREGCILDYGLVKGAPPHFPEMPFYDVKDKKVEGLCKRLKGEALQKGYLDPRTLL